MKHIELDRSHVRLLADLLIHDNNPIMKAEWYKSAYDGDNSDNDRILWYSYMDNLVTHKFVKQEIRTYGSAAQWNYYSITPKGELEILHIMDEE